MIERFLSLDRPGLDRAGRVGFPIAEGALDDSCYRGVSLGLPGWVDRMAWKTFQKVFHRDPATGALRGWNLRLEQTGLRGEVVARRQRGKPIVFGHYAVLPRAEGGLLLDYSQGPGLWIEPTRLVRDPLVAVEEGSVEWLFGWTELALGARLRTPSCFLLERIGELPPGAPGLGCEGGS